MLRTKFTAPAAALQEGWERANGFLDGVVRNALAKGRDDGGFADCPLHREGCDAATALLAQGEREAAKDLIRALARAREFGACSEAVVPSLHQLLIGFRSWTADDEFLDRYQPGLAGLDRTPPQRPTSRIAMGGGSDRGVVAEVIERLWGLWPDAPASGLHLAPMLEAGWAQMALIGLRVGMTVLDLRFTRGASGYVLNATRSHGPRLRIAVWLEDIAPTEIWIDEEPLGGQRAVFELAGEHELRVSV